MPQQTDQSELHILISQDKLIPGTDATPSAAFSSLTLRSLSQLYAP